MWEKETERLFLEKAARNTSIENIFYKTYDDMCRAVRTLFNKKQSRLLRENNMERQIAKNIVELIAQNSSTLNYSVLHSKRAEKKMTGTSFWKSEGKEHEGVFLIENTNITESIKNRKLWFFFIEWRPVSKKDVYYMVIYDESKKNIVAEIHEIEGNNKDCLFWTYKPTKGGGENPKRKKYFKYYFPNGKVSFYIPKKREDIQDFMDTAFYLVEARTSADSFAEEKPEIKSSILKLFKVK